jgi:hypothetical protein
VLRERAPVAEKGRPKVGRRWRRDERAPVAERKPRGEPAAEDERVHVFIRVFGPRDGGGSDSYGARHAGAQTVEDDRLRRAGRFRVRRRVHLHEERDGVGARRPTRFARRVLAPPLGGRRQDEIEPERLEEVRRAVRERPRLGPAGDLARDRGGRGVERGDDRARRRLADPAPDPGRVRSPPLRAARRSIPSTGSATSEYPRLRAVRLRRAPRRAFPLLLLLLLLFRFLEVPLERRPRRGLRPRLDLVPRAERGERREVPRGVVPRAALEDVRDGAPARDEAEQRLVERKRRPRPDRRGRRRFFAGGTLLRAGPGLASADDEDVHAHVERAAVHAEGVRDAALRDVARRERRADDVARRRILRTSRGGFFGVHRRVDGSIRRRDADAAVRRSLEQPPGALASLALGGSERGVHVRLGRDARREGRREPLAELGAERRDRRLGRERGHSGEVVEALPAAHRRRRVRRLELPHHVRGRRALGAVGGGDDAERGVGGERARHRREMVRSVPVDVPGGGVEHDARRVASDARVRGAGEARGEDEREQRERAGGSPHDARRGVCAPRRLLGDVARFFALYVCAVRFFNSSRATHPRVRTSSTVARDTCASETTRVFISE